MTALPAHPTADDLRALCRSSPWRWTTLHLVHREVGGKERPGGDTEAWVVRPGWTRWVRGDASGVETGVPYSRVTMSIGAGAPAIEPGPGLSPQEVEPERRDDGLVLTRPGRVGPRWVDYDDPLVGSFRWVAMLDPVELAAGVEMSDVRVEQRDGRPTWAATLRPHDGYLPRCGGDCCELLPSVAGLFSEGEENVPHDWQERAYPEAFDVAVDVATGVAVRVRELGGVTPGAGFENDLLAVDAAVER
ncbi:hypothetical protein [Nocardioides bruguierae]|uniref:Uncharacterized protein n=1 Tax=Nocardioides bruguierae TaxID=2945102 RepID=A0A9X2IF43_9ACTN|nr:hypothetical protein [Nocardioides bruguierae]MCM0620947.1 hypothetical protein [Nocardioides bruguierae]